MTTTVTVTTPPNRSAIVDVVSPDGSAGRMGPVTVPPGAEMTFHAWEGVSIHVREFQPEDTALPEDGEPSE